MTRDSPLHEYPLPDLEPKDQDRMKKVMKKMTPRKLAILAWIADGKTNPEICELLELGRKTVEGEVTKILHLLEVQTRISAAILMLHWVYEKKFKIP